jgi:glutamate N-acetyltransferase/amino-acid N-acetyltransferase
MLARDGEGATKLLRASVAGAATPADARTIARALIDSPLIKTMVHGGDPNIGRVLMAIGKCVDTDIAMPAVTVKINDVLLYADQAVVDFDADRVRALLSGDPVDIAVTVNTGDFAATAYGCDLSRGYIDENAAYYSS